MPYFPQRLGPKQIEALRAAASGLRLYEPATGAYRKTGQINEPGCFRGPTLLSLADRKLIRRHSDGAGGWELTDEGRAVVRRLTS